MKTARRLLMMACGVLAAALIAPSSSAQCLAAVHSPLKHTSLFLQPGGVRLMPAAFFADGDHDADDVAIVGFWSQKLISEGNKGIPDGTLLDNGVTQWHRDHNEIHNTATRPPSTGSVCLGTWEKTGERTYKVNHFLMVWDPTGTIFEGPLNFRTEETLSPDGNHYRGHFTLDQYDPTGKIFLGRVQGVVTATRITINSKPGDFF